MAVRHTSVERAFDAVAILARNNEPLGLSALAHAIEAPISTTQQLLRSLIFAGIVVQQEDSKLYTLGPGAYKLADQVRQGSNVVRLAHPFLERLAISTTEDVYLATATDSRVVYVDKVEGSQSVRLDIALGVPRSFHGTAVGKLILSQLPIARVQRYIATHGLDALTAETTVSEDELFNQLDEIRRRGWSLSDGESVEGVAAVAAPICHDGGIAAAVCISGPRKRIRATQDRLLDSIVEVANEIEKALQQQQGAHR
jgi:DNA-binding IclR family transcriptional regulator